MCFKEVIEYYPLPHYLIESGFETTSNQLAGRVAERLKAAASKAVEGLLALREFESHPFRQIKLLHNFIWLPQLPLRPKIGLFPFLYLNFGTKFR